MKALIGRAELLAYLAELGEDRLASIADCFGYDPPSRLKPEPLPVSPFMPPSGGRLLDRYVTETVPEPVRPAEPFYYLAAIGTSQRVPEVADGQNMPLPEWLRNERLIQPLRSPIRKDVLPEQQPLTPWEKIWPVLRHLLSVTGPGNRPDMDRLMRKIAEGYFPDRIPCLQHRGWAASAIILFDFPDRLRPFADDYVRILSHVVKMRGEIGLHIRQVVGRPGAKVRTGKDDEVADWRMPLPWEPLLIIGDAGLLDLFGAAYHEWLAFGERLREAGCAPCLLSPLPVRYLTAEITGLFHCIHWDRQSDLQPVQSPQGLDDARSALRQDMRIIQDKLLPWLSASVLVEPELLRSICRLLSLDAGFEALTRVHEEIQSSTLGLTVRHDRIEYYRNRLHEIAVGDPDLAEQIYGLYKRHHARRYVTELYEEVQVFAETHAVRPDALMDAAEIYMKKLVKELIDKRNPERLAALRHFGANFLRRQAREAKKRQPYLSSLWAVLKKQLDLEDSRPDWLQAEAALPLLCDAAEMQEWHVLQQGEQLLFIGKDGHSSVRRLDGAWKISDNHSVSIGPDGLEQLQAMSPLFAFSSPTGLVIEEFEDDHGLPQVFDHTLGRQGGLRLPLRRGVWRLHANGRAYEISALTRPLWAEAIGRDREGLFVDYRRAERRFRSYWLSPTADRLGQWQGFPPGEIGSGPDCFGIFADITVKGVTQRFRLIESGSFMMGSHGTEEVYYPTEKYHRVTLSRDFWIADTTVTQALWQAVMGENPSRFSDIPDNPVENVSWRDAQKFISRLNDFIPGLCAQLPTEAQWEYACRAGTATPFSFGENISPEQVNYNGNYPYAYGKKGRHREKTVPVKSLPPNPWGIYEMHGNVWEWCEDAWRKDLGTEPVIDPLTIESASDGGADRVVRGGSWRYDGGNVRSACRFWFGPDDRYDALGFRLSLCHVEPEQESGGGAAKNREKASLADAVGRGGQPRLNKQQKKRRIKAKAFEIMIIEGKNISGRKKKK